MYILKRANESVVWFLLIYSFIFSYFTYPRTTPRNKQFISFTESWSQKCKSNEVGSADMPEREREKEVMECFL